MHSRGVWFVCLGALPVFALAAVGAEPALRLWLRAKYVPALTPTFVIFLFGSFLSLLGVPAYYVLIGTGYLRSILSGRFLTTLVDVLIVSGFVLSGGTLTPATVGTAVLVGRSGAAMVFILSVRARFRTSPDQRDPGTDTNN